MVHTAAIPYDNPELCAAREKRIPVIERSVLLGNIMRLYQNAINICGTHGKTTTTSMLSVAMLECGKNPTITVGGELDYIGGNLKVGGREYFVTEACEYVDSFLQFYPTAAIITNIEEDHLDYFKDLNQIITSFHRFAMKLPETGLLVINKDDENCCKAAQGVLCKTVCYSVKDETADYFAKELRLTEQGCQQYDLYRSGAFITSVTLGVSGIHNIYNSLAVLAMCDFIGIPTKQAAMALQKFGGTKRRFEKKGEFGGAPIYDDYAHHPTEVQATLKTARNICKGKLTCVFQPHTYTRTRALFDDFVKSFFLCDEVIITDIYAAREKDTGLVHASDLAQKLANGCYKKTFLEIEAYLKKQLKPGDMLITMGAGDVYKIGEDLLEKS